jgi:glycosyltransferase involved in cell wall biosynthesis
MSPKTHVCFVSGQLQLGGIGRVTLNLAEALLEKGCRVDFFLSKRAGVYVEQIPRRVRVFEGRGSVKASFPALVRYLRRETPHLMIAARPHINLTAIAAKKMARVSTEVVITEHTNHGAEKRLYTGFRRSMLRAGCRLFYKSADHIVAISGAVAADLVENIRLDRGRIDLIHNPVVTPRIEALSKQTIEDPWITAASAPIILGVGRLTFQKDFHTLIRAFSIVRGYAEARLVLLGEGDERKSLESLVGQLGLRSHVHLPGYVQNPFAYMARASVMVLSSRWEGLPTVIIEAMATGTHVVATDCPGGSREILADGEFGTLVPVGDPQHLAEAILGALSNPASPVRLRERAMDFSAEMAAGRYLDLLGRTAANGSASRRNIAT